MHDLKKRIRINTLYDSICNYELWCIFMTNNLIQKSGNKRKEAIIEFVTELLGDTNLYVTPTYKDWILSKDKVSEMVISLTHQLNRQIFGNSYKRKKLSIGLVPFIETKSKYGNPVNPHAHLCIKVPYYLLQNESKLKELVKDCHKKTWLADEQINVQIQYNNKERLAKYCTKESFEALDMNNLIMTDGEHRVLQSQLLH